MKYPLKNILKDFLNHVEELETRRRLNDDQYEIEFQKLKHLTDTLKWDPEYSSIHGQKEVNRPKNRYKDIVPYDFCRVILPECAGIPGSDYVNASHVKGASGAFAYIAAQGPLPNTVIDFWKMIWICEVQVVIMACNEREGGKTKCEAYWPENGETKQFGTLSIKFLSQTQVCPDFLVRMLLVCNEKDSRQIWQFHYTSWPDHGAPDSVEPILELVRLVRDCQASETAPILVHCSAGCGRTGTICAIDFIWACLRTGKLTENFCLYDIVAEMRKQRIAMVQTKEQYMLVHKAVSTMFEQQLQLIDNHTYENLDKDGSPLTWNNSLKDNNLNGSSSFTVPGESSLQALLNERKNENLLEDLTKQLKKQLMEKTESNAGNYMFMESVKCMTLSKTDSEGSSQQPDETSSGLSVKDELSYNNTSDTQLSQNASRDSHSSALLLSSPESADSIPFIDDDDSKSEIQVRARCGRAYLHIPSCDSISKIVDRFDPFVDKVWTGIDGSCPETGDHYHSLPASVAGQMSNSENSSIISTFDQINVRSSDVWLKSEEVSLCQSNLKCEPFDGLSMSCGNKNGNGLQSVDRSIQVDSDKCCAAIIEDTLDKKPVDNDKGFSRRPSIVRLKGFFDRSSKCKSNGKTSLFRHHSHHVSRAGSAPPSLSSMKQSSEKESLFSMVTRKFRSSSVKSEQELKKENSSSHVSTLKRTALTSFSNLKQNISNFSRNMAFSAHKTPQKQTDMSVTQRSPRSSTSENEDKTKQSTSEEKQHDPEKSAPYVFRKESQGTGKVEKLPPSFNFSDGREGAQQKFVVNVLSSSHGQNVMKIGKTGAFPPVPEKSNSPKSKNFMSDFECLKANPIRLLTRTGSSKPNTGEPSAFWYGYQEENMSNSDAQSSSSASTLTRAEKYKSPVNMTQKNVVVPTKSSIADPQSIFYTLVDGQGDCSQNPLYVAPSIATQPEKVGSSSFFWPLSSLRESSEKTDSISTKITPVKETDRCKEPVQSASNSLDGIDVPKATQENMPLINKVCDSKEVIIPSLDSSLKLEREVPIIQNSTISDGSSQLPALEHPINGRIENGCEVSVALDRKNSDSNDVKNTSDLNSENSPFDLMAEPPALPRKMVIGKSKGIHANIFEPFIKTEAVGKFDTQPIETHPESVENSDTPDEIKSTNDVRMEDPKQEVSKPSDGKTDLYINVNVVAKKNIEQIESTLRNHPRGAIIDLTSRQSYSMEEELKTAVQNLPEPVKLPKFPASSVTNKRAGYEVIWPENGTSLPLLKSKLNNDTSQENNMGLKSVSVINRDLVNSTKKSGLCYSPPLRRSAMSSFPVLKSHSCASLDWLHDKNDESLFKSEQEIPSQNPQTNETLVNEAVVELSTLLDELTTKTLSDDLVLQSPKLPKKQSQVGGNLTPLPKTPNNSQANSPDVSRRRLNSPHKYEAIYLPQKQALSIKNGDEEEIIFHFPPPPRVPPPPPNKESVVESFDLLCRDGKLHFSSSKKTDSSINTDASDHEPETSLQEKQICCNISIPVPIPRKTKQTSTRSLSSLRKSASYTTLVTQMNPAEEQNLDCLDRPQTLPRSQAIDSSQKASSLSSSLSSADDETSEKAKNGNKNSRYEQIFSNSHYQAAGDKYKDISFQTSNGSSETSDPEHGKVMEVQSYLKFSDPPAIIPNSEKRYPTHFDASKGFRKQQEVDSVANPVGWEPKTFKFSETIQPLSNRHEQQKNLNVSNLMPRPEKISPVYGMVKKISGQTVTLSDEIADNFQAESQEHSSRKSHLRSRKTERAPPPPSPKFNMEMFDSSLEANLMRNKKKSSSRKSERAPDPPTLQKSSSLKVCSSSRTLVDSRTMPMYAAIEKHKLPSVFENISDPQSALKANHLRELKSIYDKEILNRCLQRTHGRGLQHSQSDASVFLALQSKYTGKVDIRSKDVLSNVKKISESSSDSDGSFRLLNFSDEQKLQKNVLKQKAVGPVAPPRSRRRSTVEIHYVKEITGAAKAKTLPKGDCDDSIESPLPNVPAKTKEAFEIPEEFKAISQPRSHSVRSTAVKEQRKNTFHHL